MKGIYRPKHRKTIDRWSMYGNAIITTYFNMSIGDVKRYMRTHGRLTPEMCKTLKSKTTSNVSLYRGYIGIKYINYNWKTKRLYIVRS